MSLGTIARAITEETEAEKKSATTPFPRLELPTLPSKKRQRAVSVFVAKVNEDRANEGLPPVDLN